MLRHDVAERSLQRPHVLRAIGRQELVHFLPRHGERLGGAALGVETRGILRRRLPHRVQAIDARAVNTQGTRRTKLYDLRLTS
ncbi:hypothetical protein AB0J35_18640 [Nonomuraea angiospora]|uniref:hypothetical protein n=1 Tax=Nonomuraea angiospora TaxID=46172 RepID=UPI00342A9998